MLLLLVVIVASDRLRPSLVVVTACDRLRRLLPLAALVAAIASLPAALSVAYNEKKCYGVVGSRESGVPDMMRGEAAMHA